MTSTPALGGVRLEADGRGPCPVASFRPLQKIAAAGEVQGVTFREGRAEDAEVARVVELVNGAYRKSGNWTNEVGIVEGARTGPEMIRGISEPLEGGGGDRTSRLIVAVDDHSGEIIGCVEAELSNGEDGTPPRGYIGMLSVDARFGSRGVGSGLLKEAERCAQSWWGCSRAVMWVVGCRTDILEWYYRCGYEDTMERVETGAIMDSINNKLLVECQFHILEKDLVA